MQTITLPEKEMSKGIVLGTAKKLPEGMDTTSMTSSLRWKERLFILNNDKIEWGAYEKKGDIPFENLYYKIENNKTESYNFIKIYSIENGNHVTKLVIKFENSSDLNYFTTLLEKKNIKQEGLKQGGKRSKKHHRKKRRTKKYLR